jgi:hypothetical protein
MVALVPDSVFCPTPSDLVASEHEQQTPARGGVAIDDGDGRSRDRRNIDVREFGIADGEDHRVAGERHVVGLRRENRAAIARLRAEVRRHHARRFERRQTRLAGEHERQFEPAHVAPVEERLRQRGQIRLACNRRIREIERTRVADRRPQRRVRRVFALLRVMPDQLHVQMVELGDETRIDGDIARDERAGLIARHGQRRRHFAVDEHLELRDRRQQ